MQVVRLHYPFLHFYLARTTESLLKQPGKTREVDVKARKGGGEHTVEDTSISSLKTLLDKLWCSRCKQELPARGYKAKFICYHYDNNKCTKPWTHERGSQPRSETLPRHAVVMGFEATPHYSYAYNLEQGVTLLTGFWRGAQVICLYFLPWDELPTSAKQTKSYSVARWSQGVHTREKDFEKFTMFCCPWQKTMFNPCPTSSLMYFSFKTSVPIQATDLPPAISIRKWTLYAHVQQTSASRSKQEAGQLIYKT